MNAGYAVFTTDELMVLLAAAHARRVYGFWDARRPDRRRVLTAANNLVRQGLLEAGEDGFRLPAGPVRRLLSPLRDPELAVLVTPRDPEQAQLSCAFRAGRGVAYEQLPVQPDAVRLFSLPRERWQALLAERGLLRKEPAAQWEGPAPGLDGLDARALLERERGAAVLEFYTPPGREAFQKVVLMDAPGERRAGVWSAGESRYTGDAWAAAALPRGKAGGAAGLCEEELK